MSEIKDGGPGKRIWSVTLPIAGHAHLEVVAGTEKEAIDLALDTVELGHIDTWEGLVRFNQGNFCYCPSPWEAEARDEGPLDDEEPRSGSTESE